MYEDIPFERENDFLVIPEVWANQIGFQCIERQLKYAIFVQNGYMIYEGGKKDLALLKEVYEQATLILSISEDTSKVIRMTFPEIDEQKIIRLFPDVPNSFRSGEFQKKRVITYMPRKLAKHAQLVNFFLTNHLPSEWSITPIQNKNEAGVIAALKESAIFLSFCESEGCPLPPLEAALSGNLVVGYTGEGAKEYFHPFNPTPNPPPKRERTPQEGDGGGGRERPRVSLGPTRPLNHRPLRRGLVAPR
jgi:hypothetical protein